jgi:hypothetical protein
VVHRSLAAGHNDPVAEALHIAGSGHGSLADDALEGGKVRCCGSGRSHAGIGLRVEEERHSCLRTVHRDHGKGAGKGSTAWSVTKCGCDGMR